MKPGYPRANVVMEGMGEDAGRSVYGYANRFTHIYSYDETRSSKCLVVMRATEA